MKPSHIILAILLTVSAATRAQVVPSATAPSGLPMNGTLSYDLRYSQLAQFNTGTEGTMQRSVVSGEVAYANANAARPTGLTYSGGDSWRISGMSEGTGVFQHLLVSQGVVRRNWALNLSDNVSYLPQAPTTGFSGIPGVGNLPGVPSTPSQSILTENTRSVYNTVSPSFTHSLNSATNLSINGDYSILRFPDGNGLNIDSYEAGPQITRRLNALNSISGQYTFSHVSYPEYTSFTMGSQSALFGYQRSWTRRLSTNVAAGPQWIQSSDSAVIPSSTHLEVNANAAFTSKLGSATLGYSQATTGGSGVSTQLGTRIDSASAQFTWQFGRNLSTSATGAYFRTQGLQLPGVTDGKYAGGSATRRIGRYLTAFVNYTAIQQSSSSVLPSNSMNGLSQVLGFGLGYSPREMYFSK
jgi:hypothetical protein